LPLIVTYAHHTPFCVPLSLSLPSHQFLLADRSPEYSFVEALLSGLANLEMLGDTSVLGSAALDSSVAALRAEVETLDVRISSQVNLVLPTYLLTYIHTY
jgi:hypothetical protein